MASLFYHKRNYNEEMEKDFWGNINPRYAAPEVLLERNYNLQIDIYAFGIVLWEFSYRKIGFRDLEDGPMKMEKIAIAVKRGDTLPLHRGDHIDKLISRCLSFDPHHRPSAVVVCESLREIARLECEELCGCLPSVCTEEERDEMRKESLYFTQHEWQATHLLPNPPEGERSHRIVWSELTEDDMLWIGCNNGSVGVIDVKNEPFDPIFCFGSEHEGMMSAVTSLTYCPSLKQIWVARQNGFLEVRGDVELLLQLFLVSVISVIYCGF